MVPTLAVLTFLAGVARCGDQPLGRETGPLALYRGEPSGDEALLSGSLVLESECLYIQTVGGGAVQRYLVVFSDRGTRWDAGQQTVRRTGANALRVGARVSLGGGEMFGGGGIAWAVPPKDGCDQRFIWVAGDD